MVLDDLVDRIYEAAVVPELWRSVLDDMTRAAGAKDSLLGLIRGEAVRIVSTSPGFVETWRAVLKVFPGASNERTRRLLAAQHAGFLVDADVFDPDEMTQLPVFRDHLIPAGYGSACATSIPAPSGDVIVVHVEGAFSDGPIRREVISAFDGLRPHLARAGLLACRLGLERARAAAAALEAIGLPAAVLGYGGRLLAANGLLADLVPTVLQDRASRIKLADPAADRLLAPALDGLDTPGSAAAVRSIPVKASRGRPPAVVHLIPIRGAARDVFAQAFGMLVMTPLGRSTAPDATILNALFDLTPAEARVARGLIEGLSVAEIAAVSKTSVATVRNQLRAVFSKTGVQRQGELVALCGGVGLAATAAGPAQGSGV